MGVCGSMEPIKSIAVTPWKDGNSIPSTVFVISSTEENFSARKYLIICLYYNSDVHRVRTCSLSSIS